MALMDDLFVVIPSKYTDRKPMLDRAIKKLEIPYEKIIIVRTEPSNLIEQVNNVFYEGELNIQKWWNFGINYGLSKGGRFFLLLNDDCDLEGNYIKDMYQQIKKTYSGLGINLSKVEPGWGHCFIVDFLKGGYFDEKFVWWFGDFDYYNRIKN
jgi:GT2 family glycosyltransferase